MTPAMTTAMCDRRAGRGTPLMCSPNHHAPQRDGPTVPGARGSSASQNDSEKANSNKLRDRAYDVYESVCYELNPLLPAAHSLQPDNPVADRQVLLTVCNHDDCRTGFHPAQPAENGI